MMIFYEVDDQYDQHVYSDGPQAVMWAIGPLNDRQEVSYHRLHNQGDMFIDFARTPKWNCPLPDESVRNPVSSPALDKQPLGSQSPRPQLRPQAPEPPRAPAKPQPEQTPNSNAWKIPPIVCPADPTLRAQIGPTGGSKGYHSITGKVGWGIAWYINGLLIPEITLQRGKAGPP